MTITENQIRDVIARSVLNFDASKLDPASPFTEQGLDSLDHATILLTLQEYYDLTIPDEAVEQCSSIKGIIEYASSQPS